MQDRGKCLLRTASISAIVGAAAACVGTCVMAQATSSGATAFSCASVAPSRSRLPAYARLPGQPVCEGFFERSVSQPFMELVSLTFGALPPEAAAAPLDIHAAAALGADLLIQPLRSGPFYRVDARLDGPAALRWDPRSMLQATGLELRDLGFLARTQAAASAAPLPVYVPVALVPASAGTPARPLHVQAVLRPSVSLSSAAWRMPGNAGGTWHELASAPVYAFQRLTVPFELPPAAASVDVDVQGLDADGKPLPMLRFTIVGPGGAGR